MRLLLVLLLSILLSPAFVPSSDEVPVFVVVEEDASVQADAVALRNPTLKSDTFWAPVFGAISVRTLTGKPSSGIALASELVVRDMAGSVIYRAQLVQTEGPRGTIEAVPVLQGGVIAFRYTTSYPDSTSVDRVLEGVALTSFQALSQRPDTAVRLPLVPGAGR